MLIKFFTLFSLLLTTAFTHVYAQQSKTTAPKPAATPQTFTAEGISIEFNVEPVRPALKEAIAGEDATIRFKITGTNGRVPLSNLRPVAWVDQRASEQLSDARTCREKVQSFLQSSFTKQPSPLLQGLQPLPQSDPVSTPFFRPSLHVGS